MKVSNFHYRKALAQAYDVVSVILGIFIVGGATSTMPAVAGGYSNTNGNKHSVGDFSTVGIVTHIYGEAYLDASVDHTDALTLKTTQTITKGNRIWVSKDSRVVVTTIDNNEITVGPNSIVEFVHYSKIKILDGMAFINLESGSLSFETNYMNGKLDTNGAQAAVITDEEYTQTLAVKADTKVWNPHLESAKILLKEGEFTDKEVGSDFLQPRRPEIVYEADAIEFLKNFGNIKFTTKKQEERKIASLKAVKPTVEKKKEVTLEDKIMYQEAKDKQRKMMLSRMSGIEVDFEDIEETNEEANDVNGGQHPSVGRDVTSSKKLKPSFELIKKR